MASQMNLLLMVNRCSQLVLLPISCRIEESAIASHCFSILKLYGRCEFQNSQEPDYIKYRNHWQSGYWCPSKSYSSKPQQPRHLKQDFHLLCVYLELKGTIRCKLWKDGPFTLGNYHHFLKGIMIASRMKLELILLNGSRLVIWQVLLKSNNLILILST